MSSIALKRFIAVALLLITARPFFAQAQPRLLQDPLIGLRYEPAKIHFEPVPPRVVSKCEALSGNEHIRGVWFVFGLAGDASGRTFYLVNGYEIRSRPEPPDFPKYSAGGYGLLLVVSGRECQLIDADARQSFTDRLFDEELPQDIVQRLANDFSTRMKKAFGGANRLRVEITNQRIDLDALPEEIKASLRDLRAK